MENTSPNPDMLSLIAAAHAVIDNIATVADHLPADFRLVIGGWAGDRAVTLSSNADTDFELRIGLRTLNEGVGKLASPDAAAR